MIMICRNCNIDKELCEFYKRSDNLLYHLTCKKCKILLNKNRIINGIRSSQILNIKNERWNDIDGFGIMRVLKNKQDSYKGFKFKYI